MALEQAIEALTKAVTAQTELLKSLKGGTAGAATAATTTKTETKPATTKKPAAAKITDDDLRKVATAFVSTTDEEERTNRKVWLGKINEHFGIAKISEAPADKYGDIIRMIKQLEAGETPPELAVDEGPAEDEDSPI